jgi:hypothetical protein
MPVTVRYLGVDLPAVVLAVAEGGRTVTARAEGGELLEFSLNRATGKYQTPGSGPRLILAR